MPLESQLRKVGVVYGGLMIDSGISLPNGRYIFASTLISDLGDNGVRLASRRKMLDIMRMSDGYGIRDNVLTGVQLVEFGGCTPNSKYTYNPLKELMGVLQLYERPFINGQFRLVKAQRVMQTNPREGVRMLRDMYALFIGLPQQCKKNFWA